MNEEFYNQIIVELGTKIANLEIENARLMAQMKVEVQDGDRKQTAKQQDKSNQDK